MTRYMALLVLFFGLSHASLMHCTHACRLPLTFTPHRPHLQVKDIITAMDLDHNGQVEWAEFACLMADRWLRSDEDTDMQLAVGLLASGSTDDARGMEEVEEINVERSTHHPTARVIARYRISHARGSHARRPATAEDTQATQATHLPPAACRSRPDTPRACALPCSAIFAMWEWGGAAQRGRVGPVLASRRSQRHRQGEHGCLQGDAVLGAPVR